MWLRSYDECSGSFLFEELVNPSIPVLLDSNISELESSIFSYGVSIAITLNRFILLGKCYISLQ
jgi:hypothetical protein